MQYDYLIVGQGLAGTVLGQMLFQNDKNIFFIDQGLDLSSSVKMGGVINPVTGRKFVKTWLIDDLIPKATEVYHSFEKLLNVKLIYPKKIVRFFNDNEDENNWAARSLDPEYKKYLGYDFEIQEIDFFHHENSFGVISESLLVDIPLLVRKFREFLLNKNLIAEEKFEFNNLRVNNDNIEYKNINAANIIFADGHNITKNPFFNFVPMNLAKGEALKVKFPNINFEYIIKKRITIEPLPDGTYWVGSNYIWEFEDSNPSLDNMDFFKKMLASMVKSEFEIVDYIAGIRPTVHDRRPLIGHHPNHRNIITFNGLGTKGISLAPFFAAKLIDNLIFDNIIPRDVDVQRFWN